MANEPNKFFDVAHPGNTAASAGSRPVIVGNRPVMQDPMVVNNTPEPSHAPQHKKIDLQPSSDFHAEEDQVNDAQPAMKKQQVEAPLQTDESRQQIEQLIDQKAHFVHIKGAKRKKYLIRFILFIGTLCAMVGVGYYVMTLMQK